LAEVASWDIVVGGDDHEDGAAVADAGGQELHVLDAAFKDLHGLVVLELWEEAEELVLVAAVGVDSGVGALEEVTVAILVSGFTYSRSQDSAGQQRASRG
jgi:hypothetical protein